MGEAKHTPGPWRWEVALNSKRVHLCGGAPKSGFGKYDLTVMSFARYGMSGAAPVFWEWRGMSGDPKRADMLAVPVEDREHHECWFRDIDHPDARLIAAAPEMLAALTALEPFLDAIVCYASTTGEHGPNRIAVDVRAVIAKATGS